MGRTTDPLSSSAPTTLAAHTARWGAANRLLVGPLPSGEKARDLVKSLKGKGIDAFTYQSPEGEEIQGLK